MTNMTDHATWVAEAMRLAALCECAYYNHLRSMDVPGIDTARCKAQYEEARAALSSHLEAHPSAGGAGEKDAARFRFLQRGLPLTLVVPTPTDEKPNKKVTVSYGPNPEEAYGASLAAAIDAAMAQEPRHE